MHIGSTASFIKINDIKGLREIVMIVFTIVIM